MQQPRANQHTDQPALSPAGGHQMDDHHAGMRDVVAPRRSDDEDAPLALDFCMARVAASVAAMTADRLTHLVPAREDLEIVRQTRHALHPARRSR